MMKWCSFRKFMREEKTFDNLDALKLQIQVDEKTYVNILIFIAISFSSSCFSQQYLSLKQALLIPKDSVTHLKISKQKLTEVPSIVWGLGINCTRFIQK